MFGEIIEITKNYAIVKLTGDAIDKDILNYHVVFVDDNKKILGEVEEISGGNVRISFLGELTDTKFVGGIIRKPSLKASIRIVNQDELSLIVGKGDAESMVLGVSPLYNDCPISMNINSFFSSHNAIFGNTGSGKTCGVSRIIQNLFTNPSSVPFNATLFIFNSYSEYHNAFKDLDKINPNFYYKRYSSSSEQQTDELLKIPLWLLDVDDYANILDVSDYSQIAVIEKTLSLVSIFARHDEESIRYKNHLIAKAILSIMYTNQVSAKIRDQIFSILTDCNTKELNLNKEVEGIGYTRQFRKCFDTDSKGEFVERILVTKYIEGFIDEDTPWNESYVPIFFTLKDLEVALNFALISEGLLLSERSYSEAVALKVRLHSIINGNYGKYFNVSEYMSLDQFMVSLIKGSDNKRAQIIHFTLEDIDDRFAKTITKVYARMLFKFTKNLKDRASFPIHIMLEEAHRYVQKDNDTNILGYNIFDRIAKEGRKYGLMLDLITQRPTELNDTTISQCTNFIIFKINHPYDLEYIRKMVPNISADIIEKQKSLQSGTCVAFGDIMKIPMIVKMEMPNPAPFSGNCDIFARWMVKKQ